MILPLASFYLLDAIGQTWRISNSGLFVEECGRDAFDEFPHLAMAPVGTELFSVGSRRGYTGSGAQIGDTVYGLVSTLYGIRHWREVTVPSTGEYAYARVMEVFENPTAEEVTLLVRWGSVNDAIGPDFDSLGFEGWPTYVTSSDGDLVGADTRWVALDDGSDAGGKAAVGLVLGDGFGLPPIRGGLGLIHGEGSDMTYEWEIVLAPGQRARVVTFLTTDYAYLPVLATTRWLAEAPEEAWQGLGPAERAEVINWGLLGEYPLTASEGVVAGSEASVYLSGAPPGSRWSLLADDSLVLSGTPLCGEPLALRYRGAVDVAEADDDGLVHFERRVPLALGGRSVALQAVDYLGCQRSQARAVQVLPAD